MSTIETTRELSKYVNKKLKVLATVQHFLIRVKHISVCLGSFMAIPVF